jgi:hypothetical protein
MSNDKIPITVDSDNVTLLTNLPNLYIILKTTHILKQENELYCIPLLYFTQDRDIALEIYDLLDNEEIVDLHGARYSNVYYTTGIHYVCVYLNEANLQKTNRPLSRLLSEAESQDTESDNLTLKIKDKNVYLALLYYPEEQTPFARIENLTLTADIAMSILEQMADWLNMINGLNGQKAFDRIQQLAELLGLDITSVYIETWLAQTLTCNNDVFKLYRNSNCKYAKMLRFKQIIKYLYPIRQLYFENIKLAIPNLLVRKQDSITKFEKFLLGDIGDEA